MMRMTAILASRSVKIPFGRHAALVCDGDGARRKKRAMPMTSVNKASMRNILQACERSGQLLKQQRSRKRSRELATSSLRIRGRRAS